MFYKLTARLLEYPQQALLDALSDLRPLLTTLPAEESSVLGAFMQGLSAQTLTAAQADYVQTFDMAPAHSLHLTHHLFGDDKNRGPALIDLSEYYKHYGLELAANDGRFEELPDYLPLMLEFVSQLEADEARLFLSQWHKVLQQLAANLERADSAYAPVLRLLEQRSALLQPQAAMA